MFLAELKMKSSLPSIDDNGDVEKAKSKVGESLPCAVTKMELSLRWTGSEGKGCLKSLEK